MPSDSKDWRVRLKQVARSVRHWQTRPLPADPLKGGRLLYGLDVDGLFDRNQVCIHLFGQRPLKGGRFARPQTRFLPRSAIFGLRDASDRAALRSLVAYATDPGQLRVCSLKDEHAHEMLALLCATGRFHRLREGVLDDGPLRWDSGPVWQLELQVAEQDDSCHSEAFLSRTGERLPLSAPEVLYGTGWFLHENTLARFDARGAFGWILALRGKPAISAPSKDIDAFVDTLLELPSRPQLDLPQPWQIEGAGRPAAGQLRIGRSNPGSRSLPATVSFLYGDTSVPGEDPRRSLRTGPRRLVERDLAAETALHDSLFEAPLGLVRSADGSPQLPVSGFSACVQRLLDAGWQVLADGKPFRSAGGFRLAVRSGQDWFDLEGGAEYGGQTVGLPRLLQAARRGQRSIELDDGSRGMVPDAWLERFGPLLRMAEGPKDKLRFAANQGWMLDALLAELPEVSVDTTFADLRKRLQSFKGVEAVEESPGFAGTLRPYQRAGLGWLLFLRSFGLGGCLADDMGLGKTVQVLALLHKLKRDGELSGPCLIVAPRSVLYNWLLETERFAPSLQVLLYHGSKRKRLRACFADVDLIICSYGMVRRDAKHLRETRFELLVLDEAQAIKNASTQISKAARLLQARQRVALSGTPVENHIGELWALFEFLNPGMLGRSAVFQHVLAGSAELDGQRRQLLQRALAPFILRRTKQQVLTELPAKVEQVLYCELPDSQRSLYDELREHYRAHLLAARAGQGKLLVLAALVRLRQAACHPGLIDPLRRAEASAKLDLLVPLLEQLCAEGHKALVFSQFTRLLGLLRERLQVKGLEHSYLDGSTRSRQAEVERFQTDPGCPLFLISLKAGGLGLNLTAAGYVFLLDPWWNPAVEAQAIDRAHRIGQDKQVIAYRLIARDTVEEKILNMQKGKRALAEAVLAKNRSMLAGISREDLEMLFS